MAWTAKIISTPMKSAGRITVRVEYSDGVEKFEEEYTASSGVDMAWLKNTVRTRIDAFTVAYAFADALLPNQAIDLTPPAAPTAAEIAQQTWLEDWARLQRAQKLVDMGIIAANNSKFVALKTKVTNNLLPAYVDIL